MIRPGLRALAAAIAIAGVVDPGLTVERTTAPAIDVRIGRPNADARLTATVRERVTRRVSRRQTPATAPDGIIIVDPTAAELADLPAGVPVSVVFGSTPPAVEIVRVTQPAPALPGQSIVIPVDVSAAANVAAVHLRLEHEGVTVADVTAPVRNGRARAELSYSPPAAGAYSLRVVAGARPDDRADAVDVGVVAESRRLRVLVYEPRPTWAVTFLRRALEDDPALDIAALARPSRGIAVRASDAPATLNAAALRPFDAVVVGAPEDLRQSEVDALEQFARERGGAVLFQPDRRPSGPYARRLPSAAFDEVLLESPLALAGPEPAPLAAELTIPRERRRGVTSYASLERQGGVRPVVFGWVIGHGRFVFSGALDAWRYRAREETAYRRVWGGLVASLAAGAPRPVDLRVDPLVSPPGASVRVSARLAPAALTREGDALATGPVSAQIVEPDGALQFVRLWPTAEPGLFEGVATPSAAGDYTVRVAAGSRSAETPLMIRAGARTPRGVERSTIEHAVTANGGVVASAGDLDRVVAWADGLAASGLTTLYPMRSAWWLVAFVGALGAEWVLRRRAGLR